MRRRRVLSVVCVLLCSGLLIAQPVLGAAAPSTDGSVAEPTPPVTESQTATAGTESTASESQPAGPESETPTAISLDPTRANAPPAGPPSNPSVLTPPSNPNVLAPASVDASTDVSIATEPASTTVAGTASPTVGSSTTADAPSEPTPVGGPDEPIDVDYEFHLDDEDPLVVDITADVPDEYDDRDGEFAVDVFNAVSADAIDAHGFDVQWEDVRWSTRQLGYTRHSLVWDGETDAPTATVEVETIEVGGNTRNYMNEDWAVAKTGFEPRYVEDGYEYPDAVVESSAPDAAIGTHRTYVGPHEEYAIDTGGQTVRLVVPADVSVDENEVREALEAAGDDLRLGPRPDEVLAIAVTDPLFRGGLAYFYPASDFWVHEDAGTDTWIHEYVHTRQGYVYDDSTRWLVEAEADYLSWAQEYERDEITFDRFQSILDRNEYGICTASDYEDVVLSDSGTWEGTYAQYCKGRLVVGELDAQVREATDGERTYLDVVRGINDPGAETPLTVEDYEAAVEAVAGEEMDEFFDRYVDGDGIPTGVSDEHEDLYGTWDEFDVALAATTDEEGLAPGGKTTIPVAIGNEGGDPAVGVEGTLEVPDGWTVVDSGDGVPTETGVYWSAAELSSGAEVTDEVVLQVPATIEDEPRLVVTDADGNEVVATVGADGGTIDPPTASLAVDPVAVEGEPVTLDADETEAESGIEEYRWDLTGDGEVDRTTTDSRLEHAFEEPGNRTVSVTVVDENDRTDGANATLTVDDVPQLTVDAPAAAVEGETVFFEATIENEVGDYTVTWTYPDGDTATGETAVHEFDPGEHELEVSAVDEYGTEGNATVDVTVTDVPGLTVDAPETAIEGESVSLEATVENEIGDYDVTWTFPDGETTPGESVERTFEPGEHEVTVGVEDEHEAAVETTHEIAVEATDGSAENGTGGSAATGGSTEDGAVANERSATDVDSGADDGTSTESDDGTSTESDDGVPGFGPLAAVTALVVATLAIRSRAVD